MIYSEILGVDHDWYDVNITFTSIDQQYVQQPQQPVQPPQTYALQSGHDPQFAQSSYNQAPNNDMAKLEALVAVATSEGSRAVEHQS